MDFDSKSQSGLFDCRYDWKGQSHARTFDDVQTEFGSQLLDEHLLTHTFKLCSASAVAGSRTLLNTGRSRRRKQDVVNSNFMPILNQHQLGTPVNQRQWHSRLAGKISFLRRTLGHLSGVYCLVFDRFDEKSLFNSCFMTPIASGRATFASPAPMISWSSAGKSATADSFTPSEEPRPRSVTWPCPWTIGYWPPAVVIR